MMCKNQATVHGLLRHILSVNFFNFSVILTFIEEASSNEYSVVINDGHTKH